MGYFLVDLDSQPPVASEVLPEDVAVKDGKVDEFHLVDQKCKGGCNGLCHWASSGDSYFGDNKLHRNASNPGMCSPLNKLASNLESQSPALSRKSSATHLAKSRSSLSLADKDPDFELKLELASVEVQYQQLFEELSRKKEEALKAIRKKWAEKKKLAAP